MSDLTTELSPAELMDLYLRQIADELDVEAVSVPCSEAAIIRDAADELKRLHTAAQLSPADQQRVREIRERSEKAWAGRWSKVFDQTNTDVAWLLEKIERKL